MSHDLAQALALRDLTDPAAGEHAMQHVVAAVERALSGAWGLPVRRDPGPRIVSVADNYDRLRYSPAAVTRDRRYSRYLGDGTMLRSHTTARIPALLRSVPQDDVLLSVPGICYRRDTIDRQHVGEPHQLDLWRVRRIGPPLDEADLIEMIRLVVGAVLPGRPWWTVPSVHPYTVKGREIYVARSPAASPAPSASAGLRRDGVEVGECGLSHPEVTAGGLAMGLGLDRLVMLAKGIDDIRLLRSTDPRVAAQMRDLWPYRPVSTMPPARRDLSVAVAADLDVELLGDRVREVLGADAAAVEEVAVLSETGYAELSAVARERIGMRPGQKNVLLRVILRDLTRTLTAAEANALRDRIYRGIHEGAACPVDGHRATLHSPRRS